MLKTKTQTHTSAQADTASGPQYHCVPAPQGVPLEGLRGQSHMSSCPLLGRQSFWGTSGRPCPETLLQEVSLDSEIRPWGVAWFVSYFHQICVSAEKAPSTFLSISETLSVLGSVFSNFLRSLVRSAKAPAEAFTVHFLEGSSFSSPAVSFSLASSSAVGFYSRSTNSSLVNSSEPPLGALQGHPRPHPD